MAYSAGVSLQQTEIIAENHTDQNAENIWSCVLSPNSYDYNRIFAPNIHRVSCGGVGVSARGQGNLHEDSVF